MASLPIGRQRFMLQSLMQTFGVKLLKKRVGPLQLPKYLKLKNAFVKASLIYFNITSKTH